MFPVLKTELTKLHRSLALLLIVAAPGLVALFLLLNGLRDGQQRPWDYWLQSGSGIWAYFMLPMSVTALTALMAHTEHAPRAWDQLRALPIARWRIYATKALVLLGVVAVMTAVAVLLSIGSGALVGLIRPDNAPTGALDFASAVSKMSNVFLAATLMIAVQFFIALRYASFVPGLVLGIAGTFFSVVATGSRIGVFLPWQMPVNMLATEVWRIQTALGLGFGLGVLTLLFAICALSSRDVP